MHTRIALSMILTALVLAPSALADLAKDLRLDAPIASPGAPLPAPAARLEISAWTNRESGRIRPGEDLEVVLKASADCYAYVVDLGTTGTAHLIFPNRKTPANQLRAGKILAIPERGSYTVRVDGPPGVEHLLVVASTRPLPVYENLHLLAPRKSADLDVDTRAEKGLRLTPGTPGVSPAAASPSPAATAGPDVEPLLAALERAAGADRARDLAFALVTLTVEGEGAPQAPGASPSPSPSASPASTTGRLTIEVTPSGRIYVDGRYRGLGRATVADLTAGEHEITIIEEAHRTHLERVVIAGGDERTVKVQLQKGP